MQQGKLWLLWARQCGGGGEYSDDKIQLLFSRKEHFPLYCCPESFSFVIREMLFCFVLFFIILMITNKNGCHIINTYYQPGLHQSNLYMLFLPHNYLELHILLSRFNIWGTRPRDCKYPAQVTQAAGNWLQVFVTFPFYIFSAMGDFLVKYWLSAEETVFR